MEKLGLYLFCIHLISFSVPPSCPFETTHIAELDPAFFTKTDGHVMFYLCGYYKDGS